jgi:hypothetical protein
MKKTLALLALAGSLALPAFAASSATPSVSDAIKATEDALKALAAVKADLGAHGNAANAALNTALLELKAGLAQGKTSHAEVRPTSLGNPMAPGASNAPIAPGTLPGAAAPAPAPAPAAAPGTAPAPAPTPIDAAK